MRKTDRTMPFASRNARLAAILCATAMTAPFAAVPAFAQSAGADEADSNVIIVTAQRRDQALEDVPMTVTLLDQDTLKNAGVTSVQDLQNVTSGFQLGRGGSTPQPSIRGVTTIINGSYENNVAVYIDGLYVASPFTLAIDLPNIENVQILKGPQGTLYGRNATGGAILIETKNPTDEWEGNVEATYGRFDDRRVGGVISGPITEGMGIALSAYTRRRDGYHRPMSRNPADYPNNPHDGKAYPLTQDMFRAKLNFEFSPTFDVTLGYGYTHTDDHGLLGQLLADREYRAHLWRSFSHGFPRQLLRADQAGPGGTEPRSGHRNHGLMISSARSISTWAGPSCAARPASPI